MALSAALIKKVTKMNRAAQDVNLGYVLDNLITSASSGAGTLTASVTTLTAHMTTSGCVAATSDDATSGSVIFLTGTSAIKGFIIQTYRSGSLIVGHKATPAATGSKITLTSGSVGYAVVAADVINWIVW